MISRLRRAKKSKRKAVVLAGVVLAASGLGVFKGKKVLAEERHSAITAQTTPQLSEDLGEEGLKFLEDLDRRSKEGQWNSYIGLWITFNILRR